MENIRLTKKDAFSKELTKRVNEYLKSQNIKKFGNWKIFLKVPVLFSVFFMPYFLMVFGVIENGWLMLLMTAIMGLGMSGIGFSVMHDANHGAFSRFKWINTILSYTMEMLGGNSINWRIQHNVLHHSFTNVHDLDEDIQPPGILRFSPNEEKKKIHKWQVYYAWFLYGMMTLSWMTTKDFKQLIRYKKKGLLASQQITLKRAITQLIVSKIIYYGYIIVIPMIFMDITWWQVLIGFATMHFISGSILAYVFQIAHVVPETEFHTVENYKEDNQEESWAKHQLLTTANFARRNPLLTWYVGGLNFQIEHHLFPDISHVHYPKLSAIVKKTANEYGVPYNYFKTFTGAIFAHHKLLRRLGKK
jgi:linoleoyl-CoA desaturase